MVSDCFLQKELEPTLRAPEKSALGFHKGAYKMFQSKGTEKRYVWPNLMGDELAKKVPPVILLTTEFDFYRTGAEEAAKLYERNGTLIEFGI